LGLKKKGALNERELLWERDYGWGAFRGAFRKKAGKIAGL